MNLRYVRDQQADAEEPEVIRLGGRVTAGAGLLPFEQIDAGARKPPQVLQNVRIPLHLARHPKTRTVLGNGIGVTRRVETHYVTIERQRSLEIGTVDIHVHHALD
jgi:hypothetical protein